MLVGSLLLSSAFDCDKYSVIDLDSELPFNLRKVATEVSFTPKIKANNAVLRVEEETLGTTFSRKMGHTIWLCLRGQIRASQQGSTP